MQDLYPPSLRGIPFEWSSVTDERGRRIDKSEFYRRDKPQIDELGRAARHGTIDGYLIGTSPIDDLTGRHKALLAAAEEEGPARLVHPLLGDMLVVVTPIVARVQFDALNIVPFTLTYVEAGEERYPEATVDTGAAVLAAGTFARAALSAAFAGRYAIAALPGFVADSMGVTLASLGSAIEAAGLLGSAGAFVASAQSLVAQPLQLASLVQSALAPDPALAGVGAIGRLLTVSGWGGDLPRIGVTTLVRAAEARSSAALVRMASQASLIGACEAAAQTLFDSYDEADGVRASLGDALDAAMLTASDAGDSAAVQPLRRLLGSMSADVTARGADLARIVRAPLPFARPALVEAYRLYGPNDLEARAADLAARNAQPHPGFMFGTVKYLSK